MKTEELLEKITGTELKYAGREEAMPAKLAFLLNLLELIDGRKLAIYNQTVSEEFSNTEKMMLLVGLLAGDEEIPDEAIHSAQCALVLPSSRAVISTCFGHNKVDHYGMPAKTSS